MQVLMLPRHSKEFKTATCISPKSFAFFCQCPKVVTYHMLTLYAKQKLTPSFSFLTSILKTVLNQRHNEEQLTKFNTVLQTAKLDQTLWYKDCVIISNPSYILKTDRITVTGCLKQKYVILQEKSHWEMRKWSVSESYNMKDKIWSQNIHWGETWDMIYLRQMPC